VNRELILAPEAETEIADAVFWYEQQKPGLGLDFFRAVDSALVTVRLNPFQYQIIWKQYRRAGVAHFPYGLIYRVTDREIIVLSCFHGRRSPAAWKART
jgi:ParE toxin of type II toxin-antitoxin system, parDE